MLRFGSVLARASQHIGNRRWANAALPQLIKQKPGQRLSSLNGMNTVNALIPGRLGQKTSERHNLKVGRFFLWPDLSLSFGFADMEKTND
jgi:hypothetical protein